jgi:ELWxxDGT repeat protein
VKYIIFLVLFFEAFSCRSQYTFSKYYIPLKSYAPTNFTPYNNKLYFYAVDSIKGYQLWHFESEQTFFDFDLNYAGKPGYATSMTVLNNKLYFVADRGLGVELYSYDGIHEPVLVKDIASGLESSDPIYLNVLNNKLYFIAHDNFDDQHGDQIWSHDPVTGITKQETFALCGWTVNSSCDFDELTLFRNRLFFRASTNTGYQLYAYDAVESRILLVNDTASPDNSDYPSGLCVLDDKLFFSANTSQYGTELYKYNGTTTPERLTDIIPGKRSGVLYNVNYHSRNANKVFFNGEVYFIGVDTQIPLNTILCSYNTLDGTSTPVLSAKGGYQHISIITELVVYNNSLFFSTRDDSSLSNDYELWKYDGINPPSLVKDINPGPESSYPSYFKVWNNSLFFTAYNQNGAEAVLYKMTDTTIKTSFNQYFVLHPNPARNICYLDVSLNEPGSFAVLVDDMLGRQVYRSGKLNYASGTVTVPIDVSNLSSDVYILRVVDERGRTIYTAKLVKQ